MKCTSGLHCHRDANQQQTFVTRRLIPVAMVLRYNSLGFAYVCNALCNPLSAQPVAFCTAHHLILGSPRHAARLPFTSACTRRIATHPPDRPLPLSTAGRLVRGRQAFFALCSSFLLSFCRIRSALFVCKPRWGLAIRESDFQSGSMALP